MLFYLLVVWRVLLPLDLYPGTQVVISVQTLKLGDYLEQVSTTDRYHGQILASLCTVFPSVKWRYYKYYSHSHFLRIRLKNISVTWMILIRCVSYWLILLLSASLAMLLLKKPLLVPKLFCITPLYSTCIFIYSVNLYSPYCPPNP